jgi:CRISPR-associated protein Cas2
MRNRSGADFAIAYDVSSDRERRRVDRVLVGFGFRIQKSVFECRLTRAEQAALRRALEQLGIKTGSIKIYRLHAAASAPVIGNPLPAPDTQPAFTM